MKKIMLGLVIISMIFAWVNISCDNNSGNNSNGNENNTNTTLIIKNETFSEISNVIWQGVSFVGIKSGNSIAVSETVTKPVQSGSGYIYFSRTQNPIDARTYDIVVIEKGDTKEFTFTNQMLIVESDNPGNTATFISLQATDKSIYTINFDSNGGIGTQPSAQVSAINPNFTFPVVSNLYRSGYAFNGWSINISGSGTRYNAGSSYTVTSNITFYATWIYDGSLNIGDIGLGGGKIFYSTETGFSMSDNGERCYYLEAIQLGRYAWASSGYVNIDIPGTSTTIGSGRKNTALILAADTNAPAAKACREFAGGGKNDWFLPSQNEFNQLIDSDALYSEIYSYWGNNGNFWSSSQASSTRAYAWILQVTPPWTLSDWNSGKVNNNIVYAVRAF